MSVVVGLLAPTLMETVIGFALNALVSEANALETLRCSWAIWLTVMLFLARVFEKFNYHFIECTYVVRIGLASNAELYIFNQDISISYYIL